MHEGWEWRRVGWPGGRTVPRQGEWCWDPGEHQALAQGQREGQSGGWTAQAGEHVRAGPGGCLSGINHLVREGGDGGDGGVGGGGGDGGGVGGGGDVTCISVGTVEHRPPWSWSLAEQSVW